ncbi:unnamed protein product, partial [Rotaria sp. Silwood1]
MMKFEELANEIILELFELLDTVTLIHAFSGLNFRLNQLIFSRIRTYHLDLRSISKNDFNLICYQYLPTIIDRITLLRISHDDETPYILYGTYLHVFHIRQFNHLQSLSLYSIEEASTIDQIILELHQLPYLTHLNIIQCNLELKYGRKIVALNEIWSLKKVTHCNFDHCHGLSIQLAQISVISQTIEYLSIDTSDHFRNLTQLIHYTPNLQRFNWNLIYSSSNQPPLITMSSIVSLKLRYYGTNDWLKNILQHMPNLYDLKLDLINIYLNGYEWENLFVLNLPNIKIFQFRMHLKFSKINLEQQINEILNSFQSSFWLEEHQWFVRCEWNSSNSGIIYTLPYAFNYMFYLNQHSSKSTCRNEQDYWSYNNIRKFEYINSNNMFINDFDNFPIRLTNLHELDIALPIGNYFWSIISSWNQLISLNISINGNENNVYFQLQKFLDQTPHLYSLKFSNW